MFSAIAYPLNVECGIDNFFDSPSLLTNIDLDGDGSEEMIRSFSSFSDSNNNPGSVIQTGSSIGTVKLTELIDLNPSSTAYTGMQYGNTTQCSLVGLFDVTGDGLPDAIVRVSTYIGEGTEAINIIKTYYVENISTPVALACPSDLDNDGEVRVTDLLEAGRQTGECAQ